MPSVRSRSVRTIPRCRSGGCFSAVSSWMTASAVSPSTDRSRPSRSSASATTGRGAPSALSRAAPALFAGQSEHLVTARESWRVSGIPERAGGAGEQNVHGVLRY